MVINDAEYDQDIIKSQILTHKSIRDNLKDEETTKDNLNDILESNIDSNRDKVVPLDDTPKEMRNKHRSKVPKNHSISNIIGKC